MSKAGEQGSRERRAGLGSRAGEEVSKQGRKAGQESRAAERAAEKAGQGRAGQGRK